MKKRNGFISISIIYSFFLVFMLMLLLILSSFINARMRLNIYKKDVKQSEAAENQDVYLADYIKSHASENANGEYRFTGTNPNNFIRFNSELWRIIGLVKVQNCLDYDINDTSGVFRCTNYEETSLIKLIHYYSLGSMPWDYKQSGVGSSTSDNGSNDWSDAQIMMMLNSTDYFKSGYSASGTTIHTSYYLDGYSVSDGTHKIYNNMGSYFTPYLNALKPALTTTTGFNSTDAIEECAEKNNCIKKISSEYSEKMATVRFDLGGINTALDAAATYNSERETNVSSGNAAYWYGKVGLVYASDLLYASDWLQKVDDTCLSTWTLTHNLNNKDSVYYYSCSNNALNTSTVNSSYHIRPVVHISTKTRLVGNHSGSKTDPFIIN